MTNAFPLLRLPYLVLMPILEQMDFFERIALSIFSRRARMFLKLLQKKSKRINLKLKHDTIEMKVLLDNWEELKLELYPSGYVELRYQEDILLWNTMGVPPMDYAVSIMDVMHCKSIYQFKIAEMSQCDILPLLVNLPKIDRVVVYSNLSDVCPVESRLRRILRIVSPVSSGVTIYHHFQNLKYLREILKKNFDVVTMENYWVKDEPIRKIKFSLNDLMMANAKTLELYNVILNGKDMNRFFKLWMKKNWNPRLEYLEVRLNGNINKDFLLKGLKTVPVPIETKRTFRVLGNVKQMDERINRECDITRADGRTATIRMSSYGTIYFYVWPESTSLDTNQSSFERIFANVYNSRVKHFK
ncbi:hypothetical protein GCK72_021227 [Caenorhabditis remanei]|uniref:F-box domain-containing protein n=1 Tax=Caenorhabditis remanei TaxID=31234 RepID=A0A6A5GIP5_CAERE|nr:hypothetical protein GCK72_021227 [Caenorhabditis remanei]KAF1754664.1 hypothetical protein GCK72_021227 [Caenorhabditis remanei]